MLQKAVPSHTSLKQLLDLSAALDGRIEGAGFIETRFGAIKQSFTAVFEGSRQGAGLILNENFAYTDGRTERRVWTLKFAPNGSFSSSCADTIGMGRGYCDGPVCHHVYGFRANIGGRRINLGVSECFISLRPNELLYRARLTKWRIHVATIYMTFNSC